MYVGRLTSSLSCFLALTILFALNNSIQTKSFFNVTLNTEYGHLK